MIKDIKKQKLIWGGIHPFSYHASVFNFIPDLEDKTILDCGCGKGIWGYLVKSTRYIGKGKIFCLDVNQDYLDFCTFHKVYDQLYKRSISELPFADKSIDFLICSEVIEHLPKKQGYRFLKEVERVMRKKGKVIITTPSVSIKTIIKKGPDAHHSAWKSQDFKDNGYKVYGMGFKIPASYGKWYTSFLHGVAYAFTPISFLFPSLGGFLIAVKDY